MTPPRWNVDVDSGCWVWTGAIKQDGYGEKWRDGTTTTAHRFVYEEIVGPIPEGLQLDHLCRTRACVNPAHLEPVTPRENTLRSNGVAGLNARKTHCLHGHEFAGYNLIVTARGSRRCRECQNRRWREHYQRSQEAAA